jgi:hypothetical protein
MSRIAMLSILMCALALARACTGNKKEDEAAEPVPATMLKVQNQAFLRHDDLRLSQLATRCGSASRMEQYLALRHSVRTSSSVRRRCAFRPIRSDGIARRFSQEITVSPGDEVLLTIPPTA